MPELNNRDDIAAGERKAQRPARDQHVHRRPETDPGVATETDTRSYEDLPVLGRTQGPLSPGATEPSDMGRSDEGSHEARPHEHPREDGTGYRG